MNGGSGSGMYDSFLMDDVWNGIPCSELLALAEAAVTTKSSRIGGENETNMHFENQDYGSSMKPDSDNQIKDEQPGGRRYLFDLNLPPTVTEPQLITDTSSQLTPITPKQTGGAGNSDGDGIIDQTADKQNDERFNLEQPQLIIEQSHDSDSMQLEVNEDFEEESSDDYNLKKTPQPKQRRRKHRPKVVTESQPKTAKKPPPPKPNASSTAKRKYVRKMKMVSEKSTTEGTNEATDLTAVRQTRNSCRRRINFEEEEQNLHTGQGTEKKTQMELKYNKAFESQSLSPITPDKSELKHEKREKDTPSRAKRGINFSRNDSNCSTSACFNETRGSKRGKETAFGSRGESLESYLSLINNNSIPGLHFPAIYKKKRTEKCQSFGTFRAVSSMWSPEAEDNDCRFHAMEVPETPTMYGASNRQSHKHMSVFGHVESFRKKRSKGLKRVRDLASFAGMMEVKQWPAHNGASRRKDSCKYHTCMEALAADFGSSIATKKRTKRKLIMLSSSYHNHSFLNNYTGLHPSLRWGSKYDLNALINQFKSLSMNERVVEQDQHALIPYKTRYQEKNALVLYRQDKSLVPFEGSLRRRNPRPKVDLDDETSRVWRLLLEDINSKGIDGTDEDKEKWWEEERNVFSGRAASFIARMHLVQGDRRFSQWKGSVVDSVIGVFLTQNVSDHLSSSAFMSLAARYPLKSNSCNEPLQDDNSRTLATFTEEIRGVDELESIGTSHELNEGISHDHTTSGLRIPPKYHDWQTSHGSGALEDECNEMKEKKTILHKEPEENCASEQSGISAESASQATVEMIKARSFQEALRSCNTLQSEGLGIFDCQTITDNSTNVHENNCDVQKALSVENFSAEGSEVTESNNIMESSRETAHKVVETDSNEHGKLQTTESGIVKGGTEVKLAKTRKVKKIKADWDRLRISAQVKQKRERTPNTKDSLDYEAVRCADVDEIAYTIKDRGMNNMLAERIKDFLNRIVKDHGSIDLEWLRDVPPDKAKEYLLSFRGLGLKSVECVRLLTLHHLAFPVDTNVGRIAVRLGWVPLQPLPESLQLHLLELYPVLESIQKYLWPRLCKLDQRTLYELHYQMITFGKVFCTKNKPNCNACPMRGECRHFASAFASARLTLPAPEEKSIVSATKNKTPDENPTGVTNQCHLTLPPANQYLQQQPEGQDHDPVIEEPGTPEPIVEVPATPEPEMVQQEFDIEDFCEDPEEIPMIRLNMEAFTQNLQTYMENNMELAEGDMSRALVALTSEAASIPTPRLKNVSQLRTEHQVYELPDSHPLLEGLDKREPDDPCSYLLAIWTPGETAESIEPPEGKCSSQESGMLCHKETCFLCNSIREANSQTVRGTLLIPCRTAMRGSFPLNGTYFQVNEVFADHASSLNPFDVPRSWLWNLPRRTVYFGTSIPTIFKGLTTEGIQYCFWRGFVCVRGFDQMTRSPRPLMARLHFPASKLKRSRGKAEEH